METKSKRLQDAVYFFESRGAQLGPATQLYEMGQKNDDI